MEKLIDELESLRNEILAWQERRFTVLTGSITLVAVLLGFVLSDTKNAWTRQQALTLLFVVLGCASLMTWYAGRASAMRGAYLSVFHESTAKQANWETAGGEFSRRHRFSGKITLNMIVSFIYIVVAASSAMAVSAHCKSDTHRLPRFAFAVACMFLSTGLIFSVFGTFAASNYRTEFEQIKADMEKAAVPNTTKESVQHHVIEGNGSSP